MLTAGRPDLVARVEVYQETTFIWRGEVVASVDRLDLDAFCFMQGRKFQLL